MKNQAKINELAVQIENGFKKSIKQLEGIPIPSYNRSSDNLMEIFSNVHELITLMKSENEMLTEENEALQEELQDFAELVGNAEEDERVPFEFNIFADNFEEQVKKASAGPLDDMAGVFDQGMISTPYGVGRVFSIDMTSMNPKDIENLLGEISERLDEDNNDDFPGGFTYVGSF